MDEKKLEHIRSYFNKIQNAQKELIKKEHFKDLLNRLYPDSAEIQKIIDSISCGAEKTVLNIPREDKFHRGSADTLYNKVIIEFENNLNVSLKHAKEQLAGYLLGMFNSGEGYNYTLIVSDFIAWKKYSPDISCIEKLDILSEHDLILNEDQSASFILTENNFEDFYYWIDRFLFKKEKQKATLKNIEEAFGFQSSVFIECFRELNKNFKHLEKFGEVQVSFEQWGRFLSIAYGSFDASESNFLVHTYLSVFSKMLAYAVLSNDDYIDDDELKGIIDGSVFQKFNISNFVDDDFFHWVKNDRNFFRLKKVLRIIAQEISTYEYNNIDEDILKGIYQELIDIDTRHTLGEYYTPDWLCARILKEFKFKIGDKVLDPACGSGSFLIAAIHRFEELNPNISVEELNNSIYGIDIHPLSVQISKTNILLTLSKDILKAKTPIRLNINLANTLLAPDGIEDFFGKQIKMTIDKKELIISSGILEDVKIFDKAIEICEELAEQTFDHTKIDEESFKSTLQKQLRLNKQVIESFYKIYESLKSVKEKGRDSIWKFIVQNLYKPYFLKEKFDYVIGNPPWFTYSSIRNEEYQIILNKIAESHFVKPERVANFPHLEIAAIFLSYCSSYFLKEEGEIAFVLPRSFFSADHHENTRSGKAKGFQIKQVWDLINIFPLFNVPASVLFGVKEKDELKRCIPDNGIYGISFTGNLPSHNCNLEKATSFIKESELKWFYIKRGKSSAFSAKNYLQDKNTEPNPYRDRFRQGATIVPRAFYFVELDQDTPPDLKDRIVNLKTSKEIRADGKPPWKGLHFGGRMESNFLFITALSKSILPFVLYKPDMVILPIIVEKNELNEKQIKIYSADDLMNQGYLMASRWFRNVENIWKIKKTEKSKNMDTCGRLNFQNGLISQKLDVPYLVIYNSSAKDANATIVKRDEYDLEFIVESKAYVFFTLNLKEAYYIAAILNSYLPNKLMKDFQTRGLFGARDIHKKILDIFFPKFDVKDKKHLKLASLGETAHNKALIFIEENPPDNDLTAIRLGRYRLQIKKHLSEELIEIDKIVEKLISV
jgi:hypothetical protein